MELMPLIVLGLFAVISIGSIYYSRVNAQQRRESMQQAAEAMGLTYEEEGADELLQAFGAAKLFNRGRRRRIRNVIQGQTEDVSICIFDYFFVTGGGKNRKHHRQTVACLRSPKLSLPQFAMRPQSTMFDAIGKTFGGQDIDFDDYPEFSRMFVLQGESEDAVRDLFREPVLQFFERQAGVSVESLPDGMFFYRRRRRVEPAGMRELLSQAYEVYAILSA